VTVPEPAPSWTAYWEDIDHRHIFAVEARDYVARLRAAVPVRPTDRVLDFGCGFGHAVELLAPTVAAVGYWDSAEAMRRATGDRSARFRSVFLADLARPAALGAYGRFDLVLANSVVQYMGRDELRRWISRWGSLLTPDGRIVLSDVPAPQTSSVREVLGLIKFARRHRFLARAVRDGMHEAGRYTRSRGEHCLTRWTPDEIAALAAVSGLETTVLPANLTHRSGRFTVVLR
jgi:cyclopropane fatty-acyl-phospholipid synthase-like methyltransferase